MGWNYTQDDQIFTDRASAEAVLKSKGDALQAKLGPGWERRQFATFSDAIEFFKDTHPHIADSMRKQKADLEARGGKDA